MRVDDFLFQLNNHLEVELVCGGLGYFAER